MYAQSEINGEYLLHLDYRGSHMQTFKSIESMKRGNIGFRISQISV